MVTTVKNRYPHEPDYAVAPGEVLQETINALGMTQADLARRTGLSTKTINQIIQGHEGISYDTALRLERVTGAAARFWNNLEALYRERLRRLHEKEQLAHDLEWLKTIPARALIDRGVIKDQPDRHGLLQVVLGFFGVNSPREWQAVWEGPHLALHNAQALQGKLGPLATWLRLGQLAGQWLECLPYDKESFRVTLEQVRRLTVQAPEAFLPQLKLLCATAGVAVALIPEIKGAPASGATQWLTRDKALLQLSSRLQTNDHFWFSFFHQAGHVLKHGKKEIFVENGCGDDAKERSAQRFAEDFLIPRDRAGELVEVRTRPQLIAFAAAVGIAPGIVLGRLQQMGQRDKRCADNDLKERFEWSEGPNSAVIVTRAGPKKDGVPTTRKVLAGDSRA